MNSLASEVRRELLAPCGRETDRDRDARHASTGIRRAPGWYRRWLPFAGPGYVVAVGYMDPGNWATALGAGSAFGYSLLSVVLLSSLTAMLLQAAAVRLGVVSGLDLAQACRLRFGRRANFILWLACEIAIIACNLAEVLGMAYGLNLLFAIPLPCGVGLTVLDVLLMLSLQRNGVRRLEAFLLCLTSIIAASFAIELWWVRPSAAAVAAGFAPTSGILTDSRMLYLAVGIVGATVMPHNLYLHSWLVRAHAERTPEQPTRRTIRYATHDSNIALGLALLVNVGILVLAAGAFHRPGMHSVSTLTEAYRLLSPTLGVSAASVVFGIGLLSSGLSSSITGTLAGQIVMEGFLDIRISRGLRAVLTRGLAIVPAAVVASCFGAAATGQLLIVSQVVLGLQLPLAVVPLLLFTTRRKFLGEYAFGRVTATLLWAIAGVLIGLNGWLIGRLL